MSFNYLKSFFGFLYLFSCISNYTMEDPTKGFWYHMHELTGYKFTRNDKVRGIVEKADWSGTHTKKKLDKIKKHIQKGANPHIRDSLNRTPLYIMIKTSQDKPQECTPELKEFIETHKVNINESIDNYYQTIKSQNIDAIKYRLDNGRENVNWKDKSGNLPLVYAMEIKDLDMIKVLLQKGSRIADINRSGDNALHYIGKNIMKYKNLEEAADIAETIMTYARFNDKKEINKFYNDFFLRYTCQFSQNEINYFTQFNKRATYIAKILLKKDSEYQKTPIQFLGGAYAACDKSPRLASLFNGRALQQGIAELNGLSYPHSQHPIPDLASKILNDCKNQNN